MIVYQTVWGHRRAPIAIYFNMLAALIVLAASVVLVRGGCERTRGATNLVVGLELGDGRLLHDVGRWPAICRPSAALIEAGTWGWLETTADQLHVSAWPSIYTGVGPGEHGVYFTFQPAPGLQGYQRFHDGLYGRPTFWRLLDAAGRRCTVFDAPYTHPEPGFAGTQLFDWGTWAHYLAPQSTPQSMLRRSRARLRQLSARPRGQRSRVSRRSIRPTPRSA